MSELDLQQVLEDMTGVARNAGALLMQYYGKIADAQIVTKAAHDFVSIADKETEQLCLNQLRELYPTFDFLGEEGNSIDSGADYRWIIDPLDGTTNFLRGLPVFAVSIGLEDRRLVKKTGQRFGERIAGVVFNPASNDLYRAAKGLGATRNGKPISVNREIAFCDAIFATGFPFRIKNCTDLYLEAWRKLFLAGSSMRRCGAASVDLCWVAQGVLDGYWELNLSPWDIAAGDVIVREAGGRVGSFAQGDDPLEQGCIWASAPQLHEQGHSILRSVFPADFAPKG